MLLRRSTFGLVIALLLISVAIAYAENGIQWTTTGGPPGGLINVIAIAPSNPLTLYAGSNNAVFITRDEGAHWTATSKGLPDNPTIYALAVTRDPDTAFAGTRDGIYRTRDAGTSWAPADQRFANQFVYTFLIDPQTPQVIYAGTALTVLRSDNNGETWNDIGMELKSVRVSALALASDSTLYAATDGGVYATKDRGARWQAMSDGLPESARPQSIVVTKTGLIVGTAQGLYRNRDGKTWSLLGSGTSTAQARPLINNAQQPDRLFAVLPQGIVRSTDGGGAWGLLPKSLGNLSIVSLALGNTNTLYAATVQGIWKTTDEGQNWTPLNTGLINTNVNQLAIAAGNPSALLAATSFGLFRSPDHGATWVEVNGVPDPRITSLTTDPQNPATVYAGSWGSSLFVSQDSGANFTRLVENLAANAPLGSLAIVRDADNRTALYVGTWGNGLYMSTDGGQKWTPQTNGLGSSARVNVLTLAPPNTLYAGTDRGLYLLNSATPNATWQNASTQLPADEVRAVLFDPHTPKTVVVGYVSNGVYRSDDAGEKWQALGRATFPARERLYALTFNPSASNILYAGTDRGIYRSDDSGATWVTAKTGLALNVEVQAIAIDPQNPETVFAGTNGNGALRGADSFRSTVPSEWLTAIALGGVTLLLVFSVGAGLWRTRFSPAAKARAWQQEWAQWENAITLALRTSGEANSSTLHKMPRRNLARALQYYVTVHPTDALNLQTVPPVLRQDNFITAQKFLSHWKAAWEEVGNEEAFKSVTGQMVDQLCSLLGFTRIDERTYKGLIGYVVRAPALRLKIPPRFPIIFVPRRQAQESDLEALRDLMGVLNMVSYFALIIDLRDAPPKDPRQSFKHLVREAAHDFIVLDGSNIRNLLDARDHARRLVEIILSQVDLTVVSPYVTSGPVPTNMFFGREHELKTIVRTVRDTNFAIVGGRKIGKTSVLSRVFQLLQDAPEYQPFYLDCQAVLTHEELFETIDTMWKMPLATPTPEAFRRLITDLPAQYPSRTIVMLFDEIDSLLNYDIKNGEPLFRIIRALAQELPVRFVFCGEKVLNAALHNPQLVFFNFCNLIPLTYLSKEEARRVVIDPMQEMGITLEEGNDLADQTVELAAEHPNLVQYICQQLIERINHRRERIITRADIDSIARSAQFAEYFVEISWGNATPLERLITLLMLEHPAVTQPEIADLLRARNLAVPPAQLEAAFEGLTLYSILRRDGPKYTFAAHAFPEVLRRSQDVVGLVGSFTQEIRSAQGATP